MNGGGITENIFCQKKIVLNFKFFYLQRSLSNTWTIEYVLFLIWTIPHFYKMQHSCIFIKLYQWGICQCCNFSLTITDLFLDICALSIPFESIHITGLHSRMPFPGTGFFPKKNPGNFLSRAFGNILFPVLTQNRHSRLAASRSRFRSGNIWKFPNASQTLPE